MTAAAEPPAATGRPAALTPARLRARRQALGLSQEGLGRALGMSAKTIAAWERGEQRLANPVLLQLAIERLEDLTEQDDGRHETQPRLTRARRSNVRTSDNLPASTSPLIGRRTELRTVQQLVATHRLVTVCGTAGIGKTRLALEVARRLNRRNISGVWLVELAGLASYQASPAERSGARVSSGSLAHTVAAQLEIRQAPGRSLLETLVDTLADQAVLLVLDNCEHVVDACAELVEALLHGCARLRILATSRQPLGVAGELTWRVPPLSLPGDSARSPEQSLRFEAIALFVTRARSAEPAFALTLANVSAVVELCRHLDGLPLAIELAAARMTVLGPQQLADRLDDRFRLLAVDHPRAPAHHNALQAALDWSFTLLSAQERRLFERLAIFAGGFSLEAAEVVCSDDGIQASEVLALLSGLIEKSLVLASLAEAGQGTERRYRLLETVRQYAAERLASTNTEQRIAQRHCDWCLSMMVRFEAEFRGPDQSVWFQRIEQEHGNLLAALRWCIEYGATDSGLRLAGAAWRFWEVRGYLSDAREWLGRLLDQSTAVHTVARGKILDAAGHLAILQGDQAAGLPLVEEGLALARELDDRIALANGFHSLGLAAQYRKDYPAAEDFHQRSLDLAQQAGDRARTYVALYNLAVVAQKQKHLEHATELHEASLALKRQAGDRWSIGYSLLNLGILAWMRGDLDRAAQLVQEALRLRWELGDKPGIAACLETLAEIGASEGRARRAARLYGSADGLLQAIGVSLLATRHDGGRGGLSAARSQLGEAAFAAAYNGGRGAALERAVAEALASEHGPRPSDTSGPGSVPALTPREHQVAELVARGMSNRQIALELTIADGTAARHVANIFTRLGFRTRSEVAAWAVAEQLATR